MLLASLVFTAPTAGDFTLGISSDGSDLDEGIYTWFGNGDFLIPFDIDLSETITVASATVPEPATVLLLVPGLIGMAGWKKRRSV